MLNDETTSSTKWALVICSCTRKSGIFFFLVGALLFLRNSTNITLDINIGKNIVAFSSSVCSNAAIEMVFGLFAGAAEHARVIDDTVLLFILVIRNKIDVKHFILPSYPTNETFSLQE